MNNLYWIGLNESEIEFSDSLFEKSITLNGSGDNNISYSHLNNVRLNYNVDSKEIGDFYSDELLHICQNDNSAKFMFYNPFTAYYYGAEIVSRTICLNSYDLLKKIKNKIYMRKLVEDNKLGNILQHIELDGRNIHYDHLIDLYKQKYFQFVVQAEHSDGGNATYILNKENCSTINFDQNVKYSISPYIKNSISINTNIVIYDDDVAIFPSSIQIIKNNNNRLCYKGADFIAYKHLPTKVKNQVDSQNSSISKFLQSLGYRGICGIDYISDGQDLYFMEVNERFQASTYLLNMELCNRKLPCIQEMCIDAFASRKPNIDLCEFDIDLSNYAYSNDFESNKEIEHFLTRAKGEPSICKIVLDGYNNQLDIQKSSYLFKTVYNVRICGISPDNTTFISNNIVGLSNFDIKKPMDVKIALICCGIYITEKAKKLINASGGICKSVNQGINITIFDDITVICLTQNFKGVMLTPFSLDVDANNDYVLNYYNHFVSYVTLQIKQPIMKKITQTGTPYSNIATLALDRVGINYQPFCIYKKNNIPCKFCNLPNIAQNFTLTDIYEVVDSYIENVDFRHFLIGGGTSNSNDDYEKILAISKYISEKSNKPIYVMSLPIEDKNKLKMLKQNGVTEIAFNIELFDRKIAKEIMPGKGNISIENYYTALKQAVEIWNEPGAVRSMIVVGLESKVTLLDGIEKLAKLGVSPILSPFGPARGSMMENEIPGNFEYFKDIYMCAKKICKKYNVTLGPTCNYCKNNALAINFD